MLLRLDGNRSQGDPGYDLALTELLSEDEHVFLVEVGSQRGAEVIGASPPAADGHLEAADGIVERTAASMGRSMDTDGIKGLLYRNLEHPRWDDVAARCLACGNCTLACPTCFCSSVEDGSDLAGDEGGRQRVWDSCFARPLLPARRQRSRQHALALPPVDDPQARDVDRPVRHERVRRMRAVHHVVPGRDRHHRGGRRDPRSGSRRPGGGVRWRRLSACSLSTSCSATSTSDT